MRAARQQASVRRELESDHLVAGRVRTRDAPPLEPDGRVVYRLRRAWRDGASAIVFEPLLFPERPDAAVRAGGSR